MKYARFKHTDKNIYLLAFRHMNITYEIFDEYLDDLLKFYHEHSDFILIIDGTNTKFLDSPYRTRQARWINLHEDLIKEKCLAQYYVVNNPVIRFTLSGIFLIKKPPVPYKLVSNFPEALEYARKQLTFQ